VWVEVVAENEVEALKLLNEGGFINTFELGDFQVRKKKFKRELSHEEKLRWKQKGWSRWKNLKKAKAFQKK